MLICLLFFLIILLPPRSTRTDTLFPYSTLFRYPELGSLLFLANRRAFEPDAATDVYISETTREADSGEAVMRIERSEEHTSEIQSLMRISYAVFCLKNKKKLQYVLSVT